MKLVIQQPVFINALEKGALAALSEEAQADTSIIALIIKSVNIKVDSKNLTVESATKLLATKCVVPITKDGGIDVKEEGEILVPAKELYDWVKRQSDCKLAVSLSKLDTHDIVNPIVDSNSDSVVKGIKRIGTVKILSKDETKTGTRWSLDCYAPDQLGDFAMHIPNDKKFEITAKNLNEGLKNVAFAIMPKHYQHVYDSVSFQKHDDKLYMMTCDTARAALFEATEVKNNKLDMMLLVPTAFLIAASKHFDENENVAFYFDSKNNKIYVVQGTNLVIKMATTDPALVSKFPSAATLINKKYKELCQTSKGGMANRLITASLVNENSALFVFKDNQAIVHAISASGKAPTTCNLPVANLKDNFDAVWGVNHTLDYLRILKDEEVNISIPSGDKNSVKLTTKADNNLCYFIMTKDAEKTKYDKVKIDA